jgi:hypothetical protein
MLTDMFASMHACTLHLIIFLAILAYKQPKNVNSVRLMDWMIVLLMKMLQ